MRVLVTGASGMLGRATATALLERGDEVTVLQRRPSGLPCREVLGDVADRAAVGVGPRGVQQVVLVVETQPAAARPALADLALTARVREAAGVPVAAVLVVDVLPTDVRHTSKVERTRLARGAERVLPGGRLGRP